MRDNTETKEKIYKFT